MNFTTQIIKSKYLEQEFEVSCWEMHEKNGRALTIIEHAAIEDIIFNKIDKEGFTYELEPVVGVASHPVFKCVMTDGYMRKIIAIGEAEPSTLINHISRQNPSIMASNRAFDRAAIRYLNLEGKVYSSEEIPEEYEEDADFEQGNSDATTQEETLFTDTDETDAFAAHKSPATSNTQYDPGTVLVNFGKYRDKNMTVAEIWAVDESWANYTATMNVDKAGEATKKQVQAIKDYKNAQH